MVCFSILEAMLGLAMPWIWQRVEMHDGAVNAMFTLMWLWVGASGAKFIFAGN